MKLFLLLKSCSATRGRGQSDSFSGSRSQREVEMRGGGTSGWTERGISIDRGASIARVT